MVVQAHVRWLIAHITCSECGRKTIARATTPKDAILFAQHEHGSIYQHCPAGPITVIALTIHTNEGNVECV